MMKGRSVTKVLALAAVLFMLSAPAVMAQDICKGDLDYDGSVSVGDTILFLEDLGRNPYSVNPLKPPCPPNSPAPLPETGQTTCYNTLGVLRTCEGTGEDGEYQAGTAWPNPRFTDNGDGTVRDSLTALTWLKDANCIATNYPEFDNDWIAGDAIGDGKVTWQHALDFVAGINDETYPDCGASTTDWRLSNRSDLNSLIHTGFDDPALPDTAGTGQWSEGDPFTNVQSFYYWSSTTRADVTFYAWIVNLDRGIVVDDGKSDFYYVWPVREGR
ncbi:MAG: DUF1566 domain-containing protein [Deltaproteobacteria bacterium]|nr:DUF1566 domain-containing protein [Deltaproteobacteria bacterium]